MLNVRKLEPVPSPGEAAEEPPGLAGVLAHGSLPGSEEKTIGLTSLGLLQQASDLIMARSLIDGLRLLEDTNGLVPLVLHYESASGIHPGGSQLVDAQTQPTPPAWMDSGVGDDGAVIAGEGAGGAGELSTFLVVPFGGERTTVFHYRLPPGVVIHDARGWRYSLRIQKQPGVPALPLTVRLLLPPNAAVLAAAPAPVLADRR